MDVPDYVLIIVLAWMCCWSLVSFIAFGVDKRAARHGNRRIPEMRLHLMELLGGWPGAFLGAILFRHKIAKASYMLVLAVIIIGWVVLAWVLFTSFGSHASS